MADATEEEMLRYTTAYIATSNALGDAIITLTRLEAVTLDDDERDGIRDERRELEDRYARNERNFLAFHAQQITMHPPTQEEVNAIVELASQLAQMTWDRTGAQAVVDLATKVADRFDQIHS